MTIPPFAYGAWVALAFVEGKYNPPSARGVDAAREDFLGIYVSREDPGLSLITFTGPGEYRAFHRCGESDATAEFAMIDAFIHYKIPFEQWRAYPIGPEEQNAIRQLGLQETYNVALKGLAAVLYQARRPAAPGHRILPPMFLLFPRSNEAIHRDDATTWAVYRSLLGEEHAARHMQNLAKLKQRFSKERADEGATDPP